MAREQAPAFQFYARDWLASGGVAVLSLDERGAYITLLARCWLMVELPLDDVALAALAGTGAQWWARHGERVMRQFERGETGYRNVRLDEERSKQDEWMEKSVAGGRASVVARRLKNGSAQPRTTLRTTLRTIPEPPLEPTGQPFPNSSSASSSASASASTETRTSANADASPALPPMLAQSAPSLPKVQAWTEARKRTWKARWREHPDEAWWRDLFARIERSDFLCGRTPPRDGHASFKADVFWCLKPDNLAKILEGRYDNRPTTALARVGRTAGNQAAGREALALVQGIPR
jgi:uncharacterized protein YdaU (DUF1376 family)